MRRERRTLLQIAILIAMTAGCGQPSQGATAGSAPPAAAAAETAAPSPPEPKTTCALLPSSDVDPILGTSTIAEAGGGGNTCTYGAAGRLAPPLVVQIDRGGGEAAMMASGMLKRAEPGIASPLDGLGDAATQIGPALWIRVGDDLVMLTFFGVDDSIAAAKRLMAILRPRL